MMSQLSMAGALKALNVPAKDVAHTGPLESFFPEKVPIEAGLIFVHGPTTSVYVLTKIIPENLGKWEYMHVPNKRGNRAGKKHTYDSITSLHDSPETMPEAFRVRTWRTDRDGNDQLGYYPFSRCNPYCFTCYKIGEKLRFELPRGMSWAKYVKTYEVVLDMSAMYTLGEGHIPAYPSFGGVIMSTRDLMGLDRRRTKNVKWLMAQRKREAEEAAEALEIDGAAIDEGDYIAALDEKAILQPSGETLDMARSFAVSLRDGKKGAMWWLHQYYDMWATGPTGAMSIFIYLFPLVFQGWSKECVPELIEIKCIRPLRNEQYAIYATFDLNPFKDDTFDCWVLNTRLMGISTQMALGYTTKVAEVGIMNVPEWYKRTQDYSIVWRRELTQTDLSEEDKDNVLTSRGQ